MTFFVDCHDEYKVVELGDRKIHNHGERKLDINMFQNVTTHVCALACEKDPFNLDIVDTDELQMCCAYVHTLYKYPFDLGVAEMLPSSGMNLPPNLSLINGKDPLNGNGTANDVKAIGRRRHFPYNVKSRFQWPHMALRSNTRH